MLRPLIHQHMTIQDMALRSDEWGARHYVSWKQNTRYLRFLPGQPSPSWWHLLAEAKREACR